MDECRQIGLDMINNSIKAYILSEPLKDKFIGNQADSSDINWLCYFSQQVIELGLKGLIKFYGVSFRKGHFLSGNAKVMQELIDDHRELAELDDLCQFLQGKYSIILAHWENISRYYNIYVKRHQVVTVSQYCDDLYKFLHKFKENLNND